MSGREILPTHIQVRVFEDTVEEETFFEEPVATPLSTKPVTFQEFIDEILPPAEMPHQSMELTYEQIVKKAGTEELSRETEPVSSKDFLENLEEEILSVDKSLIAESIEVPRVIPARQTDEPIAEMGSVVFPVEGISSTDGLDVPTPPSLVSEVPEASSTQEGLNLPTQPPQLEPVESPIPLDELFEKEVIQQPIFQEAKEEKEKRSFEFWDDMVDIKLRVYRISQSSEAYFELSIIPKLDANIPALPKQVALVVDCSASIGQRKLDKTLQGVKEALKNLNPEDVFNVVIFRDRASYFMPGYVKSTPDNISKAQNFIINLESLGRTDVYSSLLPLVQSPVNPNMANVVYLFSDGRPTTGLTDARQIIANLTVENSGKYEIYTLGGGQTADQYLLYMLAYVNKGEANLVPNIDKIPSEIIRFFSVVSSPILVNVKTNFAGLGRSEVYPFVIPNFYKGRPIKLYGRYNPQEINSFVFRVEGISINNRKKEIIFKADLATSQTGGKEIMTMWAMHKAYYIISKIIREGMKQEYLSELEQIKKQYKVGTVYTP
ncbi:MAG: VWA domain-containing protein [Candidatus Hydrogenedentes bacterium]|nr:VWA domain-containing protein [Candidatus Hydrogenedentota bacterium]